VSAAGIEDFVLVSDGRLSVSQLELSLGGV
jgi:hypothetical protein